MSFLRKCAYLSLKFVAPAMVVLMPVGAIWGAFHPWPSAQATLDAMGKVTPVTVGFSERYSYIATSGGEDYTHKSSRTYLLVPSQLAWPRVITVTQSNQAPPEVSEPSIAGFFALFVTYIVCVISSWWFWLRGNRSRAA